MMELKDSLSRLAALTAWTKTKELTHSKFNLKLTVHEVLQDLYEDAAYELKNDIGKLETEMMLDAKKCKIDAQQLPPVAKSTLSEIVWVHCLCLRFLDNENEELHKRLHQVINPKAEKLHKRLHQESNPKALTHAVNMRAHHLLTFIGGCMLMIRKDFWMGTMNGLIANLLTTTTLIQIQQHKSLTQSMEGNRHPSGVHSSATLCNTDHHCASAHMRCNAYSVNPLTAPSLRDIS